ncbi:MAG: histidine phosphatase family protein [Bryobacteraceae bacterium]|nr:MAG: histidine phosphatase family protein [Bryobacteraceae bacterium]
MGKSGFPVSTRTIFLIRHGQAGTRDDYDRLSPLGREQARRLGQFFLREGIRFDRWVAGGLRRQQETAAVVREAFLEAGAATPECEIDARWSEFDLDEVYAGIAPQIAAHDEEFRARHEEMLARMRSGDGAIHRQWTPADTQVVRAWIEQRYPFEGESWDAFISRVEEALRDAARGEARSTAVFTSATPAAIAVAFLFGSRAPLPIMRMAGAALNANFTILDVRDGVPALACFNAVPHLDEPRLRTFR